MQHWDDHRKGSALGVGLEVLHNAVGAFDVLVAQRPLQFKDIVILADANVLLDVVRCDACALRQEDLKLGELIGHFLKVVPEAFCEQFRDPPVELQAFGLSISCNPLGELVVADFVAQKQRALP